MNRISLEHNPIFLPPTSANDALRREVAPPEWINPSPSGRYNLVVIGAGSGGLVSAVGAAGLGARVALVEKNALGGDCLNVGCVPSKALLSAARAASAVRQSGEFGIDVSGRIEVDFPAVMERMRRLRAKIAPNDSAARLRSLGVDVFFGEAKFKNERVVVVGNQEIRFSKAVIATGARAIILPIRGLAEAEPLTNETLFSLTELPKRLAIIGAGPIGCEMAQAFARFGSEVTLFETECRVLPCEDEDAAAVVQQALRRDRVRERCEVTIESITRRGRTREICFTKSGSEARLEVDHILMGVGRAPNVEGLGLGNAGVNYTLREGIKVDPRLRTSNPRIFAVGDVCMPLKFTHMADATARIAIQNALFKGRKCHTDLLVPWCTYTDPEIAHIGLYEPEARSRYGSGLQTFTQPFGEVDRSILEGREEGFVKIHAEKGTIVGATIVGPHAGDLISEIAVAMHAGMKLGTLASVIHPYPTTAEAIRRLGDAYNRTRLTQRVRTLFHAWLKWTR